MSQTAKQSLPEILRHFRPYPEYKDSNADWLGKIPVHWEVQRLKHIASVELSNVDKKSVEGQNSVRLCNYIDVYYNERITPALDFMAATATPEQVRRFALHKGDVLITKDSESWTDIAVPAVVSEDLPGVICGYHLAHIRPRKECNGAFLSRAFAAIGPHDQFQVAANGITRFGLGSDTIRTGVFAMPTPNEQSLIVAFLDRETLKIDALVAKKERLIELLQEKRAALITHAVTKGLDPTVPMKDSGVEWLGQIPAHWTVRRLKFLAPYVTSGSRGWAEYYTDEGPIFLRIGNLSRNGIDLDLREIERITPPVGSEGERTRVKPDDLLISITAYIGSIGVVPLDFGEGYVNQHIALVRPASTGVSTRWLAYILLSAVGQKQFQALLYGGTKEGLGLDDVTNLVVSLPTYGEQESIINYIDRETAKLDALIAKVREGIEKLKEYRTALISAAVTGKIDVREPVSDSPEVSKIAG